MMRSTTLVIACLLSFQCVSTAAPATSAPPIPPLKSAYQVPPKPALPEPAPARPRVDTRDRIGDTHNDPIPINLGDCVYNDTGDFNDDYDEVCPYSGSTSPDIVYSLYLDQYTSVEFFMCESWYDTKVYVYTEDLYLMGCNDDACYNSQDEPYRSRLEIYGMPPGIYYIVCDGWNGDAGEFELCVNDLVGNCQPASDPDDVWDAMPSHAEGWIQLVAEQFHGGGLIEELQVSGLSQIYVQHYGWIPCLEDPMQLAVNFYEGELEPTSLMCSYTIETSPYPTGIYYGNFELYEFILTLPEPCYLESGWILVYSFNDCVFFWMSASQGDLRSLVYYGETWQENDYDRAFCLTLNEDPPPPPADLVAELLSGGEVWLGWTEPYPIVDYYTVYRDGSYIGTTPDTEFYDQLPDYGEHCYTVTATNLYGESDPSEPECVEWMPDQVYFDPVNPTMQSYDIIVIDAWLGDESLQVGDEIGVFDGDLCVGAGVVYSWPLTITTWQEYPPYYMPGFTPGNPIIYRVWSDGEQTEYPADAYYIYGDGTFGYGPYSEVNV